MSYVVSGLPLDAFRPLFGMPDAELTQRGIIRRVADGKSRFPCRISLRDAEPGDSVLLLNHESHSVDTPYRSSYAIFVNEGARATSRTVDSLPPVLRGRPIALRIFDGAGMLIGADLGTDEKLKAAIVKALDDPDAAYVHAHNAAHGCFAARIDRG